jgi:hypothetical protein
MRKIKMILAPGFEALQKNIDKWIEAENPYIESASTIAFNPNSISCLYNNNTLFRGN